MEPSFLIIQRYKLISHLYLADDHMILLQLALWRHPWSSLAYCDDFLKQLSSKGGSFPSFIAPPIALSIILFVDPNFMHETATPDNPVFF
jgi:hypothetical protein